MKARRLNYVRLFRRENGGCMPTGLTHQTALFFFVKIANLPILAPIETVMADNSNGSACGGSKAEHAENLTKCTKKSHHPVNGWKFSDFVDFSGNTFTKNCS